ncbi:RNA polymerase subunit sigma [Mycobacterium malmoense]|uniref:RNA polymerase subunit sigma n=1 Tax=Mycobacterium malmoense TaxID=1780 RepID=UPI0020C7D940|nr:RNA polymerase subunit sigma [Mycobacterium malmoense]
MSTNEDETAFARTLFAPDDEGDQVLRNLLATGEDDRALNDKQEQRTETGDDKFTEEQRQWARDLFADDEDAGVLAGLTDGRTVGRTTPPRVEPEDKGPWFDRTPIVDD